MKLIPLSQGLFSQVDDSDYEYLIQWKWHAHKDCNTFYAQRSTKINGKWKTVNMHRIILDVPFGFQTDHIDHDGLNNQRNNLRICTINQNQMNYKKTNRRSSKYKGVSWNKKEGKWVSNIKLNQKRKYLGCYTSEIDAAKAYDNTAIDMFGNFARTNQQEHGSLDTFVA